VGREAASPIGISTASPPRHAILDLTGDDLMLGAFASRAEPNPKSRAYINNFGILSGGGNVTYLITRKLLNTWSITARRWRHRFSRPFRIVSHQPEKMLRILDRYAKFGLQNSDHRIRCRCARRTASSRFHPRYSVMFSHPAANERVLFRGVLGKARTEAATAMYCKD